MSVALRIGVFDSGVGGLSVLRWLVRGLPQAEYVYFGDTARVPYGNRSAETVIEYTAQGLAFLDRLGVDLLVVACNTASALALAPLRPMLRVPALGVIEAGIDAVLEQTRGSVLVLGTRATIASGVYRTGLLERSPQLKVYGASCPLLVPLAEEGWGDSDVAAGVVARYLAPHRDEQPDTILLGCTHFPVLEKRIAAGIGWSAAVVDPGRRVAERVAAMAGCPVRQDAGADVARGSVYVTDSPDSFRRVADAMGLLLDWEVTHVSPGSF